jgi:hypothetical protein
METCTKLYIDLMERCLLGLIYKDGSLVQFELPGRPLSSESVRENGLDWPIQAHSMIGLKRMQNIRFCVERVLADNIPGDVIETGVWRGGACIFMRALLKAHGANDRFVWVADSFQGLPKPNPEKYPLDRGWDLSIYPELSVSIRTVKENFARYDLLDEQVRFLEGWFKDTLPSASVQQLAIMRLDGDLYESTMDALDNLYSKLSVGGYVIVDDYGIIPACRQAVTDYRARNDITDAIIPIDHSGIYWRRSR